MAVKIFAVKNKTTRQVERLVKAETRGQVNKHLASVVEIEAVGAVDLVDLLQSGTLRVEDATAIAEEPAGPSGAGDAAPEGGQTGGADAS